MGVGDDDDDDENEEGVAELELNENVRVRKDAVEADEEDLNEEEADLNDEGVLGGEDPIFFLLGKKIKLVRILVNRGIQRSWRYAAE